MTVAVEGLGHVQRLAVDRYVRDWYGAAFPAEWSKASPGNRSALFIEDEDVPFAIDLVNDAANRLGAAVRRAYDATNATHWRALERVAQRISAASGRGAPCDDYMTRLLSAIGPKGNTIEHLARAYGRSEHITQSALTMPRIQPFVEFRADGRWHRRHA